MDKKLECVVECTKCTKLRDELAQKLEILALDQAQLQRLKKAQEDKGFLCPKEIKTFQRYNHFKAK